MRTSPAGERSSVARAGGVTGSRAAGLRPLPSAALICLAWAAAAGLSGAAIVHASGLRSWPFELIHHFVPVYLAAAALLLGVQALRTCLATDPAMHCSPLVDGGPR